MHGHRWLALAPIAAAALVGCSQAATVAGGPDVPPGVTVQVTPATPGVDACHAVTLVATVTGTTDTAVNWSIEEGAAGGTITSAGVYTAPSSAGLYHAWATSAADPTRRDGAAITVTERVLSVQVTPGTAAALPGGSPPPFTAHVTTTCGTTTATLTLQPGGEVTAR